MTGPESGPSPEEDKERIEIEAKTSRDAFIDALKEDPESSVETLRENIFGYNENIKALADTLTGYERDCWIMFQQTVTFILAARMNSNFDEMRDAVRDALYEHLDNVVPADIQDNEWWNRINNPSEEMYSEAERLSIQSK